MRDLGRIARPVVLGVLAYAALVLVNTLLKEPVDHVGLLAICLGVAVAGWYAYDSVERTAPPVWPAPPIPRELPTYPTEYRARRLQTTIHDGLQGQRIARADLAGELADALADRLVAHHGADPTDPLRAVERFASPGLAAYVRSLHDARNPPPRLRRATLTAYLKEIESL